MTKIDFTMDDFVGAFERRYPESAAGWVDGVFAPRREQLVLVPHSSGSALVLRGRRVVEESEALGDDPNTIARETYLEGTFARLELPARDWRLTLEFLGGDADQRLEVVVNGVTRARVVLPARVFRTVGFVVPLERRELELGVVAEGEFDDGTTGWGEAGLAMLSYEAVEREPAASPRILIAADSTVQTYFDEERPQSGWGEWLYWYLYEGHRATISHDDTSAVRQARVFMGEGPTIYNKALGGRAFKSYAAEHRFERLLEVLRPGDAVLIAFGGNDTSKARPMRYASPDEFAEWTDRYVVSIADRGATPVLVTTTPNWWDPGTERVPNSLDEYAEITRAYAAEHGVAFIDLKAELLAYLATLPDEAREAIFLRAQPLQYASHPDGVRDGIHLSTLGAFKYAGMVARGLARVLPWVTLASDVPAEAPEPAAPASVRDLSAENVRNNIGLCVQLAWDEPEGGADYYTVGKFAAETGRAYSREVTIKPEFLDLPLPGQSRHVVYEVTAWADGLASDPVRIPVSLPVDDAPAIRLG